MKRVEYDPYGGWIARDRRGVEIFDKDWRWNSCSVARSVVWETDALEDEVSSPIEQGEG